MEILALIVLSLVLLILGTILLMAIMVFTGVISGLDLDEEDYEEQEPSRN